MLSFLCMFSSSKPSMFYLIPQTKTSLPPFLSLYIFKTNSELALLHNDISPLENMHAAILSSLIRDTGCFDSLKKADKTNARAIMISIILGTDTIHHQSQISDLRVCVFIHICYICSLFYKHKLICVCSLPVIGKEKHPIKYQSMFIYALQTNNNNIFISKINK
jgi:hypothetical protein